MHGRTLILLVLLVGVLGAVAFWQKGREEAGTFVLVERLFPGVETSRITSLRLDHIERSFHLRLERGDGDTPWRITDPIEYPAEPGMVERLLDVVAHHRGGVPMGDPGTESFDPPRAIVTVEWTGADGVTRESSIEVGPVDLDGDHVLVRSAGAQGPGPVRRTLRNVDTLLARTLEEWRSHRLSRLAPRAVVAFTRTGTVFLPGEGGEEDLPETLWLDLFVEREGRGWRMVRPDGVRADGEAVELLVSAVARVEVVNFVADVAESREALALFGLDQPEVRLDMRDQRGKREVIEFGRAVINGSWFARRVGGPHVFEVAHHTVMALTPPSELFMDRRLTRLARERVGKLVIEGARGSEEGELVISRVVGGGAGAVAPGGVVGQGSRSGTGWIVEQDGVLWPADPQRVSTLLAVLEQAQVERYFRDGELPTETLAAIGDAGRFRLTGGGVTEGGVFGEVWSGEEGLAGHLYRRDGDRLACLMPEQVLEALSTSALGLRSPRLVFMEEIWVARLTLQGAGRRRVFEHGRDGRWREAGGEAEAQEVHPVLDPLLFLRAAAFLEPRGAPALEDEIGVTLTGRSGQEVSLTLGRVGGGTGSEARAPGMRAALDGQALLVALEDLLDP
jgi:hypothetical protein